MARGNIHRPRAWRATVIDVRDEAAAHVTARSAAQARVCVGAVDLST
jgi:hypothetical protein